MGKWTRWYAGVLLGNTAPHVDRNGGHTSREKREKAEADRIAKQIGIPAAPHHYSWPREAFKALFEKQSLEAGRVPQ
jgi:hypothetical protein